VRGAVRGCHGWLAFRVGGAPVGHAAAKKERNRSDYEGATAPLESASARSVRQTCPPSRRHIARFRVVMPERWVRLPLLPDPQRHKCVSRKAGAGASVLRPRALATSRAFTLNKSATCRGDLTAPAQYPSRGNRTKSGAGSSAEKAAHCDAAQRPSADTASASASCRLFPAACPPLTNCTANKRS
jgi:hypothetical protein